MTHSYDDAAYYLDRAGGRLAAGDTTAAVESVAAAAAAVRGAPPRGLAREANGYARGAVAAMRQRPPDVERAETYLDVCARTVEEMAGYERAELFGARPAQ
ncbi:hypothetical protein [Halorarius halobius]|uniref:hypothetical protein n=1 Tax=Halorarius halobius TaxID=2962671 RepID=UPI0020CD4398|nr:hypothetical protein [Halorarius halobius]